MYAQPGQAELFYYRSDTDPADAKSLDGKRYGDQPYAFQYKNSYNASCATQLTRGIAALGDRYLTAAKDKGKIPKPMASVAASIPQPIARQSASEDPATIGNAVGGLSLATPAAALADTASNVRQVGDGWYAQFYSTGGKSIPNRPVAVRKPVPGFLVGTANADELEPAD
jgi:hypothetical protein